MTEKTLPQPLHKGRGRGRVLFFLTRNYAFPPAHNSLRRMS